MFKSSPPVLCESETTATSDDYWNEELQAMYLARKTSPCPLGHIPLVVLLGAEETTAPPEGIPADQWQRLNEEKKQQKLDMAALSHNSKVIVASHSGHHIQLDQPQLVIDAIRQVIDAVRQGTKLKASDPIGQ